MYEASVDLPAVPRSVAEARRFARSVLQAAGVGETDWDVVQVVSELATNAVVHAGTTFIVLIGYDATSVRVEVTDAKPLLQAAVRRFSDEATTGRGLRLVQMLGRAWGVDRGEGVKTVWCELDRRRLVAYDERVASAEYDDDVRAALAAGMPSADSVAPGVQSASGVQSAPGVQSASGLADSRANTQFA